jgi:hypothetical protein
VDSDEAWCFARANLKSITFKGNATWTSAVKQNYGGTVTWKNS